MASQDDFLNTLKNMVSVVNGYSQAQYFLAGQANSLNLSSSTLIKNKAGWCARISVVVAGSTTGLIYDSASISGAVLANNIAIINNAIGIQIINFPFVNGLVFVPGSGMFATISYS